MTSRPPFNISQIPLILNGTILIIEGFVWNAGVSHVAVPLISMQGELTYLSSVTMLHFSNQLIQKLAPATSALLSPFLNFLKLK